MDEHEEFEQIPWSELTTRPPDKRKRLMYMVAGGVGVLVLVVLAARAFTSSAPAQPAAPAVTVAQADTSVAGEVASTTAVAGVASTAKAVLSPESTTLWPPESVPTNCRSLTHRTVAVGTGNSFPAGWFRKGRGAADRASGGQSSMIMSAATAKQSNWPPRAAIRRRHS